MFDGSNISTSSSTLVIVCLIFILAILVNVKKYFLMDFICIFQMTYDAGVFLFAFVFVCLFYCPYP